MHLYTVCQAAGLAILWIVKSTPAALVFPFFVVFMIPLRLALKFIFTPRELEAVSAQRDKGQIKRAGIVPGLML
jgi:hypothetical protein